MLAAKAGLRAGTVTKVAFSLAMAALGVGLQHMFSDLWPALCERVGATLATTVMCGFIPASFYWGNSLLIGWRTGWNDQSSPRKLQPGKGPARENYFDGAPLVLLNTLVIGPGLTLIAEPMWGASWQWWGFASAEARFAQVPDALTFLGSMVIFLLVEEVGFYYGHRLAHHPSLYSWVHKPHHTYTAPVAYAAVYAHPLEHIVVNVAPVIAGPVLLASHPATAAAWICLALIYTTNSHCGYFLVPYVSPEGHDWHHEVFNENYGVLGILDSLHGTDTRYKEAMRRRDKAAATSK